MPSSTARCAVAVTLAVSLLAGCGSDATSSPPSDGADRVEGGPRPTIVVTTNILGDVVDQLVGEQADVVTIMPVGADPHDFRPSAQEVDELLRADALVVNGAGFEEGLLDVVAQAEDEGVPTVEAIDLVGTITLADGAGHDDHADGEDPDGHADDEDGEHADEGGDGHAEDEDGEHGDEGGDGHGRSDVDPHLFTDPVRMAEAARGITEFLGQEVTGLDADALATSSRAYLDELAALDAEIADLVERVPEQRRVLVTNHEVFGYFADRYGFEVVGAVIPSGSTTDGASAGDLSRLAGVIEDEGVPAIFADTSSSNDLVDALAAEAGDVEVVELFSESLGEPGGDGATYLDMQRTNAERITTALT